MTTIAYDGKFLACDTQGTTGDKIDSGHVDKIRQVHGKIFAFTGTFPLFQAWIDWWIAGKNPKELPVADKDYAWCTLWVFEDGVMYQVVNEVPYPQVVSSPCAIGSGRDFALGAMSFGATAEEAVEVSIGLDINSGGDVRVYGITQFQGA